MVVFAIDAITPLGSTMRKLPTNDAFCSTREAAERLGVALRTIQVWVENGVLPAWKTAGGHRRIARGSLERLFSERALIAGQAGPPVPVQQKASRLSVLAVDDDADIIQLYEMQIASWGLPVDLVTADDGVQGLVRLGQLKPHILVLDLLMPNLDGFQVIQSLQNMSHSKGIEIIVVSGLSPAQIAKRGGLPADVRVLSKPLQFPLLRQIVEDRCVREGMLPAAQDSRKAGTRKKKATATVASDAAVATGVSPEGKLWSRRSTDR